MKKKETFFFTAHGMQRCLLLMLLIFTQFFFSGNALAQSRRVTGVIRDAGGAGLPGVAVQVKGQASSGAISDSTGRYSIQVPGPKAVLVFSSIGFINREETIGSRSSIDVSLLT
ncbi:MAG: carboxypeptidase-like regulatory domain-containing protein, partial [Chitinophagaceae bacterium]|nr:carboxypeptidase-like regulatory domain-containing protein [Chitinophagaceae bacterium]